MGGRVMQDDGAFASGDDFVLGVRDRGAAGGFGAGNKKADSCGIGAGEFIIGGDGDKVLAALDFKDADVVTGTESGFAGSEIIM